MRTNLPSLVLVTIVTTMAPVQAQGLPAGRPSGGAAPANPAEVAAALPLHATRQAVFAIPFTVDRRVAQPLEVHLYVSADQGASWQLAARQPPHASQFTFRSRGDGEYWFASRTLDAGHAARPPGPVQVELRVAVDTVPPQLEFQARVGAGADVLLDWQAFDQHLVPTSLKIEYQERPGEPWKPIAITPPVEDRAPTRFPGHMTWRPETRSSAVNLRAEVRDRAGNQTVVNRRLLLPAPTPSSPPGNARSSLPHSSDPFARIGGPSEGSVPWPNDHPRAPRTNAVANVPQPGMPPPSPGSAWGGLAESSPTASPPPAEGGPGPAARGVSSGVTGRPGGPDQHPGHSGEIPPLPPGERPQMTNATRFRLDYDVDAVGPSGVAEVQLWATADGGQTWRLWGVDEDRESPFDVVVEDQGIFGFRVVLVSHHGLSGRKPRSGDPADIWVGVDTTPPEGRLTSATYGEGAHAGKLFIQWQASDNYLGSRPITLLFSESGDGPWTVIASALPNTGEFAWPADPQLPATLYLRLEVRDEAGNLTADQLSEPIRVEGLAPKARIRGVQPMHEPDREAFRHPRRG
jgi:hypothetical protein